MASVESRCLGQDNFTLENVCRLCLFSNFPMRNIFRTHIASGDEIYKVLNYLFGLEVTVNDQLPPNICQPCLCKVTAFFAFKRNALLAKSGLIEIVDALRIVVPREETDVKMCNPMETIEERQLTSDGHVLNASKQNEAANSESGLLVENNEKEVENQGIHFNTLEAQLAMKEEIDIVERNTKKDLITEHDSLHENETEVIEGQSFLSTENHQPTEMSTAEGNDPLGEPTPNEDDNISVGENKENSSHGKVFPKRRQINNSPEGLCKLGNLQKRRREQDEEGMVIRTESVDKLKKRYQRIPIENGPTYVQKEQEKVDLSAKGKDVVVFEEEKSGKGISRKEGEYMECSHCGEKRVTQDEMIEHISTVHFPLFIGEDTGQSKAEGHKCRFCHKVFKYKSRLTEHIKSHGASKPFKCDLCGYSALRKCNLKVHLLKHMGEKQFKCDQCEYKSYNKTHLKSHMFTHTGEKPFKCDLCEYRCTFRYSLKLHLRRHTGEKPFKCNLCDFRSSRGSDLTVHYRRHTGEKPFKCNFCEYRVADQSSLTSHLRKHTHTKPFKCDWCEYKCTDRSSLVVHLRRHTGEKPYKCQMCDFSTKTSSHVKRHMLKRHPNVNL